MLRNNLFLAVILVLSSTCARGEGIVKPIGDGSWYYTIGGGDPMMYYHQSNKTSLNLEAGVEWRLFRRCSFDPAFAIRDTFSDIEENLYGMTNDVLDAAIATFSAWGLSKIQENYPGMYDQLVKGLADAKESYQLSLKNCRDVQEDLRAGNDPVDGWISVTRRSDWAEASKEGENPVKTEKKVEENAGSKGITWVGGERAGGKNLNGTLQPPINAVGDVVGAGYNHLVGDFVLDLDDTDGMPEVTGNGNIARVFANAEEAADWTTSVVGERSIRTCPGCERLQTQVGQGLRYQYMKERKVVDQALMSLISSSQLDVAVIDSLSNPAMGVVVNEHVIRSLQNAPAQERAILANKLSGELSLARVMEKAFIARDLMNSGAQEPNVAAVGDVADREIQYARKRLQQEIDNVLFEAQVRDQVLTNAAGFISQRGSGRNASSKSLELLNNPSRERGMDEGGVKDD